MTRCSTGLALGGFPEEASAAGGWRSGNSSRLAPTRSCPAADASPAPNTEAVPPGAASAGPRPPSPSRWS